MHGDQYQYILLAEILGGSIILFMKFHFNSPFYNEVIAKLWSALMSINLWTAMMLVFSKIMENTLFEGSIIAWMIGIPFIVLIVLTNRDHRIDLLLINVNKFQNGEEIQNQIRYILKLISWQATNRNAAILLDGYIEIHKQTCNKDDCPLKQKVVKNSRLTKSLLNNDENLNEKYALLIQLLYKMYFYGIKKFPNNTSLRISYAFFLLEKMHSKQQALQELGQAEQNKPPFDEQFIIFRYKKIIEDEIAESQNEGTGGLDVVSEIAFQNHLRQCQANIEKSALLHMEFWSQLSEDNPDLAKLNDIGSKINTSVAHVEEHWIKLQKINTNMPKAMRLYGKFLIEIINDKEGGEELLERARNIMNINTNKKAMNMVNMAANDDFANEATPTIFMSGEQDKFAIITGINLAAASMFGYNKTELINRKVNVLMPQIYSKYHDSFVENYLNNNDNKLANTNKEKFVFGKNKSNYIFPVYLSLKAMPSILQGIQFVGTFRQEKNFKNAAYILTTPDGVIDGISSSCINLLKVDLKMITQKKSSISDFVPNIIKDRGNLFSSNTVNTKSSANIQFNFPKDSEYWQDGQEPAINLNCFLIEIVFMSGRENAGFQFRFERQMEKNSSLVAGDRRAKISNFQFRYERNKASIVGEYADANAPVEEDVLERSQYQGPDGDMMTSVQRSGLMGESVDIDASGVHDADPTSSISKNPFAKPQIKTDKPVLPEGPKRVNYGEGIKTMRLYNGRPIEIEDAKSDDASENGEDQEKDMLKEKKEKEQVKKQEEENQDEVSFKEFNTTFRSRKALNAVINDRTPPSSIRNLKITANLLIVSLFVIACVDYFITANEFADIQGNLGLIDLSNQRIAELMNVLSKVRDLNLMQQGLYNQTYQTSATLQAQIAQSLINVEDIQQQLQLQSTSLSAAHSDLLTTNIIPISFQTSPGSISVLLYNLDEATQQVISKAFNIQKNPDITIITQSNNDYYFVTYNLFNEYYEALRSSSEYYVEELVDRSSAKGNIFMILLIVSALSLVLAMIILFPVLFRVNKTREEVLSLFLDIPEKTVKALYAKCENFISNLQVGEDDDMVSEMEDESFEKNNEEQDIQDFHPRKKRKKFKNSGKSQRNFFFKFLIGAGVIEAYFIYNYFESTGLLDDINSLIGEYNATSMAESFYSFANNAERELMINTTFPVINAASLDVAVQNIKSMYSLDSSIHQDHSINIKIHSDNYKTVFNTIMMQNPCILLQQNYLLDPAQCAVFADGSVFQGMAVALTRHFENLRYMLTLYVQYANNPTSVFSGAAAIAYKSIPGNTLQQNNELNILNLNQAFEVDTMQHTYIKYSFAILMQAFQSGLNDEFNTNTTNRLIFYIFFNIILVIIYFIFWLPLVSKLNRDIWRTKSMLTMIPLNVVAKIRSVRVFLRKFLNDRNIANY
jgi:PAS domain S-box-containing protein